jgi:succinyl-diaminopimelate desuccinylase
MDVISLTKKLISFDTVNPPGNETPMAEFVGGIMSENGFNVEYFNFGENRKHIIAEKGVKSFGKPLIFSGHFDTVALGNNPWNFDPFKSETSGDKIYGRGSSDMKSGLAAMICAAIGVTAGQISDNGVRFIITAGEELGCQGIQQLIKNYSIRDKASAIIVGEPTGNIPAIGHKGAIYLSASTSGKTAHSSMPELGINAIYKAARAITRIEEFRFNAEKDSLLGFPTINVGKINGGMNINSVPDRAEFTIDIRTTTTVDHEKILKRISMELGTEIVFEKLVDLNPVYTTEQHPFTQLVYKICNTEGVSEPLPMALAYLTDGSVLQKYYNDIPAIILGPGQPEMAHQTDEFCYISKIEQAVSIYKNIILKWRDQS